MDNHNVKERLILEKNEKQSEEQHSHRNHSALCILLSFVVVILIVVTLFIPWWSYKNDIYRVTDGIESSSPDLSYWWDFGLTSFSKSEKFAVSEYASIDLYYYHHWTSDSDIFVPFFNTILILVLITLIITIILFILTVLKGTNKIRRNVNIFSIIPLVTSGITIFYFALAFPNIWWFSNSTFIGSSVNEYGPNINKSSWGPTIGFYIFIITFIILLILTLLSIIEYHKKGKKRKM